MARSIWKFTFNVNDWCEFNMPVGAVIRHISVQNDTPCLWAEVDLDAPSEIRRFRTYGTGHPMDNTPQTYLGTYFIQGGRFVFHLYEQET